MSALFLTVLHTKLAIWFMILFTDRFPAAEESRMRDAGNVESAALDFFMLVKLI